MLSLPTRRGPGDGVLEHAGEDGPPLPGHVLRHADVDRQQSPDDGVSRLRSARHLLPAAGPESPFSCCDADFRAGRRFDFSPTHPSFLVGRTSRAPRTPRSGQCLALRACSRPCEPLVCPPGSWQLHWPTPRFCARNASVQAVARKLGTRPRTRGICEPPATKSAGQGIDQGLARARAAAQRGRSRDRRCRRARPHMRRHPRRSKMVATDVSNAHGLAKTPSFARSQSASPKRIWPTCADA